MWISVPQPPFDISPGVNKPASSADSPSSSVRADLRPCCCSRRRPTARRPGWVPENWAPASGRAAGRPTGSPATDPSPGRPRPHPNRRRAGGRRASPRSALCQPEELRGPGGVQLPLLVLDDGLDPRGTGQLGGVGGGHAGGEAVEGDRVAVDRRREVNQADSSLGHQQNQNFGTHSAVPVRRVHPLAAGVPLAVVSKRLGHSSESITSDTYSHLLEGVSAERPPNGPRRWCPGTGVSSW